MPRRISVSPIGAGTQVGTLDVQSNIISTSQANESLILDANGTGIVEVDTELAIRNQGDLRLLEATANGTNYIAMQAASNMAGNYTITWPAAVAASSGFVLSSDTNGTLSWSSAGGNISITDPGSVATVHYALFATNAGAVPTTLAPNARSNLTFVPSTGIFSSPELRATASTASTTTATGALVVTGGVGVGGQLTVTTLVETSSKIFKENINPIENALQLISQLVGVTYDRKDNKEHEAGLIAEDVYDVAPDFVSLDEDGNPYGIKYTKMIAYLIESIKQLKTEVEQLKAA